MERVWGQLLLDVASAVTRAARPLSAANSFPPWGVGGINFLKKLDFSKSWENGKRFVKDEGEGGSGTTCWEGGRWDQTGTIFLLWKTSRRMRALQMIAARCCDPVQRAGR